MTELAFIVALKAEAQELERQSRQLDEEIIIIMMKVAAIKRLLIVYGVGEKPSAINRPNRPVGRPPKIMARVETARPTSTIDHMVALVSTLGPNGFPVSLNKIHSNANAKTRVINRLLTMALSKGKLTYADGHYRVVLEDNKAPERILG